MGLETRLTRLESVVDVAAAVVAVIEPVVVSAIVVKLSRRWRC